MSLQSSVARLLMMHLMISDEWIGLWNYDSFAFSVLSYFFCKNETTLKISISIQIYFANSDFKDVKHMEYTILTKIQFNNNS